MQEKLHQLLCSANVAGICIVDDAIGEGVPTFAKFKSLITKINATGTLEELNDLDDDFDFEQDSPALDDYSKDLWDNALPDKQLQYMRLLYDKFPDSSEESLTKLGIGRVLEQLQKDEHLSKMELKGISPTEWDDEIENIISRIPPGKKMLVLFDQKLEQAGGRFNITRGIDLVSEVINGPHTNSLIAGILTYTVPNESLELAERAKLTSEKELDSSQLFVLTKERLQDLPKFIDGIKKLLLNNSCEQIKVKAIEITQAALNETSNKLRLLDTYDFSHAVLDSSLLEGVWAPETLFRIIDIIYKDEIKNNLLSNNRIPELNNLLTEASKFTKVDVPISNPETYQARYALRKQELYAEGRLINGLFKPIENGDIFEVTNGAGKGIYILLSQPCDLMIRQNGERGVRAGNLLKIKTLGTQALVNDFYARLGQAKATKLHKFNYWETRGLLEHMDSDPAAVGIVEMPRAHIVNLDILDFSAFSANGIASLDISSSFPLALNQGLAKRFAYLHDYHKKLHEKLDKYRKNLNGVKGGIAGEILDDLLPSLSLDNKLAKTSHQNSTFSFGIKRVKALRDPYAKNMLDKYTRYLSRTGNLHDFA